MNKIVRRNRINYDKVVRQLNNVYFITLVLSRTNKPVNIKQGYKLRFL